MFILTVLLGLIVAGTPLLIIELLTRRFPLPGELSRKAVHVGSSLSACLLPLFCSRYQIILIALVVAVLMVAMHLSRLAISLYNVGRSSWGEVIFPLSVALVAYLAPSALSYVAAMLVMGFADTAAAVAGRCFGGRHLPWSRDKTFAGTGACLVVALILTITLTRFGLPLGLAIGAGVLATLAEALTPYGLDNLTVPLAVTAVLSLPVY